MRPAAGATPIALLLHQPTAVASPGTLYNEIFMKFVYNYARASERARPFRWSEYMRI